MTQRLLKSGGGASSCWSECGGLPFRFSGHPGGGQILRRCKHLDRLGGPDEKNGNSRLIHHATSCLSGFLAWLIFEVSYRDAWSQVVIRKKKMEIQGKFTMPVLIS